MLLVKVCRVDLVPEGSMRRFEVEGREILLARHENRFYAVGERCTHKGGPLSEGSLEEGVVTCPWHFGQFDVRTGGVVGPPPFEPLERFEVRVDEGAVYVSVS